MRVRSFADTNHTPSRANPEPATCIRPGGPSTNVPKIAGTEAETTAATGEATLIRPEASARYNAIKPAAPAIPPIAPHSRSRGGGGDSRKASASPANRTPPTRSPTMMTPYTFARFVANPPQKSPAPQTAADSNPNTIGARSEVIISRRLSRPAHLHRVLGCFTGPRQSFDYPSFPANFLMASDNLPRFAAVSVFGAGPFRRRSLRVWLMISSGVMPCSNSHSRLGLSAPVGHTPTHCPQKTHVVAGIGLSKNVPMLVSKPRPLKLMA